MGLSQSSTVCNRRLPPYRYAVKSAPQPLPLPPLVPPPHRRSANAKDQTKEATPSRLLLDTGTTEQKATSELAFILLELLLSVPTTKSYFKASLLRTAPLKLVESYFEPALRKSREVNTGH